MHSFANCSFVPFGFVYASKELFCCSCRGYYNEIVFGDLKLNVVSNHNVTRTIMGTDINDHPSYVDTDGGSDITLIELADPITFTDHVRPLCLPGNSAGSETRAYRRCYAAGWGTLVFEGDFCAHFVFIIIDPSVMKIGIIED